MLNKGFDTIIAAKPESGSIWQEGKDSDLFTRLDSGDIPRLYKEKSYIGLKGLCCITHTELIRQEAIFDNKVGLFEVNSLLSSFEVRSEDDRKAALHYMKHSYDSF
jgi:hypothetical protein